MLKSRPVLGNMHLDDVFVFPSNVIGKYEDWPDNLHSVILAKRLVMCQQ